MELGCRFDFIESTPQLRPGAQPTAYSPSGVLHYDGGTSVRQAAVPSSIRDRLAQQASEHFVGRDEELRCLLEVLADEGPLVLQVHGLAGVGKTSLLDAFCSAARARGATVLQLDCRAIEPTERGILYELDQAIGGLGA